MRDPYNSEEDSTNKLQNINEWFESLPKETFAILKILECKIGQMETFDLLSNISFYNHIHDSKKYSDYREDRMFVISELIAMIALKKEYVAHSTVEVGDSQALIKDIQDLGYKYFSLESLLQMKGLSSKETFTVEGIASRTKRDETNIRNPGFPDHHLMFSEELYTPLESEIKKNFGFTIRESVILRRSIVKLINKRYFDAIKLSELKSIQLAMQVFKYRSTGNIPEDCTITKENLEELNNLSRKQIKTVCYNHCISEMFFRLGDVYCFSAKDLKDEAGIELIVVEKFLKQFSCSFPSLSENDTLVGPSSILRIKPLIKYKEKFLLPSMPLLVWCVEPIIEEYIKSIQTTQDKFKEIKHNFLLKKGIQFFRQIFGEAIPIYTNLYYYEDNNRQKRCETDCLFLFERTLFIVEAKAHRISAPAKQGKINRTQKHLEEIVRDSYNQCVRTLKHVTNKLSAEFIIDKNKKIIYNRADFDEVILISLILEPLGNVIPLIRATNELGYFNNGVFPMIISIYDLIILADHFELPILFPHYIKRRKQFLGNKILHVFEEIDLMSYYLSNRLYIEGLLNDAESKETTMVYFGNETDEINNYYMQKYSGDNPDPPKLKLNLPEVFIQILNSLMVSKFTFRQELMQHILDLSPGDVNEFDSYIGKVKNFFSKDGKKHDCSILSTISGKKVGITFMTGLNQNFLNESLFIFCEYKRTKENADIWIGIGDINQNKLKFDIQSAYLIK